MHCKSIGHRNVQISFDGPLSNLRPLSPTRRYPDAPANRPHTTHHIAFLQPKRRPDQPTHDDTPTARAYSDGRFMEEQSLNDSNAYV